MSPLNSKNNEKKEHAAARDDQIDLEEAIAAADAPDEPDEAHRQRMKEGFQGLLGNLKHNTTRDTSRGSNLAADGGRMRPGATGTRAARIGVGAPNRA